MRERPVIGRADPVVDATSKKGPNMSISAIVGVRAPSHTIVCHDDIDTSVINDQCLFRPDFSDCIDLSSQNRMITVGSRIVA